MRSWVVLVFCVSQVSCAIGFGSMGWQQQDFANYVQNNPDDSTFELRFIGHEVNLKGACAQLVDTQYNFDVIPIQEIETYLEQKYGVEIDTQRFEEARSAGLLQARYFEEDGDDMIKYDADNIQLDGVDLFSGSTSLAATSWAYLNWSDYKDPIYLTNIRNKFERGKANQLQIFVTSNLFGATVYLWLRIKKGEPDDNGLYELVAATQDTIDLPISAYSCETDKMRESMAALNTLLE